jgi:phosphoribosyl 1,2-cyclic phosphodiesterase
VIIINFEISVLASGSSGNSIYVTDGSTSMLIDAGLSGKELSKRMNKVGISAAQLDAILITHEHRDHISGVGVMSRRYNLPIYANQLTWEGSEELIGPVSEDNCCIFDQEFMLGNIGIRPFSISHDASDPVGYILHCNNKRIGIATDMGYFTPKIKEALKGLDFLVVEANHDLDMLMTGSYPWSLKNRIKGNEGHLSNDDAAALIPELVSDKAPRILLGHLSKDNNNPDLAYITIKNNLDEYNLKEGKDYKLEFTYRDRPTQLYKI